MSIPRFSVNHYEWKLGDAKLQSAIQTPAVKVSGPEKHRMVPKGLLLNFAPKWRWHLNSASVRTIRVQDLPQPQLDFVLDWMLDGGDDFGGCGGPRVPKADVPTMHLLLGFVEALDTKPLANIVKKIRNSMLLKLSPEEQAYHIRGERGTEFLIASTNDTVETYVAGVRSLEGVTSGLKNEKTKTDPQDEDSVVRAKMDDNEISSQKQLAEKNLDSETGNEEAIQISAAGKDIPPMCMGREKNNATKILTSREEKGKEAEEEGETADVTANVLATEEEEHEINELPTRQDPLGNESVARDHTVELFVADDIIRELLAGEQAEADYFAAEKLASEILAADVLVADLAEEEHIISQQAAAWERKSERVAIETHSRLNPKSKVESPSSDSPPSRSDLDATATKQNQKPDSSPNKREKEELQRAVQLSIQTKSTPYHCFRDASIKTPDSSSSSSDDKADQQGQASPKDQRASSPNGKNARTPIQSRPPSRVGDTVVESEDSVNKQEDIVVCMQRECQIDHNNTTNTLPPPTATEAGGQEKLHPESPATTNTDIDNSEEITILLAQPSTTLTPTPNSDSATTAAYHNALIADCQASSVEDWCVRHDENEDEDDDDSGGRRRRRSGGPTRDGDGEMRMRYEMSGAQQGSGE